MALSKGTLSRLKALQQRKHRVSEGVYVIEGPKVIRELLDAGHPLLEIYATAAWNGDQSAGADIPIVRITDDEMARISHYPTPSVVLAIGPMVAAELTPGELTSGRTLALDGIQDAGNVGTLLRLADWFGFDRVLLSPNCADTFSQKVINASMGSFARMRTIKTELAPPLAAAGVPVLGCDLAGQPLATVPGAANVIVVIGSEGQGLSADVAATLTTRVTIPGFGHAESLNAGVAAGIVLYHLRTTLPSPN